MSETKRILGIDPGSRVTGYGIIESDGARTRYIASGCIRVGSGSFAGRLNNIYSRVGELVAEFEPREVAVEQVFMHRNADSALKLGQARAAAICGTFSADTALFEYAAREIKQAVVGKGGADKRQVQHMVKAILSLREMLSSDESDALAAAICHAHSSRIGDALQTVTKRRAGAGRRRWRRVAG
ncbi:MAG: crossover junction endodeoxyribonuclease RuvC [Gammaproteobacteria bacterium]